MPRYKRRRSIKAPAEQFKEVEPGLTLQQKYDAALAIIQDSCGWTEEKVEEVAHQGTKAVYHKALVDHVHASYSCLCHLKAKVENEGEDYYYYFYTHVDLPFRVFTSLIDVDTEDGCPMEFWTNGFCESVSLEMVVHYYESHKSDLLTKFESENHLLDQILCLIKGNYDFCSDHPGLLKDLKTYIRKEYLDMWTQGHCLGTFETWFPEYAWDFIRTYEGTQHWFTAKEWSSILEQRKLQEHMSVSECDIEISSDEDIESNDFCF